MTGISNLQERKRVLDELKRAHKCIEELEDALAVCRSLASDAGYLVRRTIEAFKEER